jgi:crossover junction endodeoxyribonuclease RuvC
MTIIIGIDPGSRITGYGVIRVQANQSIHLASGAIKVNHLLPAERLQKIHYEIQQIICLYQPEEAAIEQIFMHENPGSALKLGQARGAAIVALTIPVSEYSARQVKQSVVGYGAAKKEQVQHMVGRILNLSEKLQADEADALAIALCHAHSRLSLISRLASSDVVKKGKPKRSSWRDYKPD